MSKFPVSMSNRESMQFFAFFYDPVKKKGKKSPFAISEIDGRINFFKVKLSKDFVSSLKPVRGESLAESGFTGHQSMAWLLKTEKIMDAAKKEDFSVEDHIHI